MRERKRQEQASTQSMYRSWHAKLWQSLASSSSRRRSSSSRNVNVDVHVVNVFNRISLSRASHAGKRQPKKGAPPPSMLDCRSALRRALGHVIVKDNNIHNSRRQTITTTTTIWIQRQALFMKNKDTIYKCKQRPKRHE